MNAFSSKVMAETMRKKDFALLFNGYSEEQAKSVTSKEQFEKFGKTSMAVNKDCLRRTVGEPEMRKLNSLLHKLQSKEV